jgi:3-oxoacyl-[acyl-carrier protein] reductase
MNTTEMKESVRQIVKEKRNIDVLVNNAGIAQYDAFAMLSIDTLKNIFEVNYNRPLQFTQMISRRMSKEGASIVFLSSVAGIDAVSGNTAYGASKAAIAHSTRVLSKELAGQKIRVNAVAPGMVDTAMKYKADEDTWNNLIRQTSLKRAALPEEIANVICFMASDLSSYITGQVLRVDGGMN